MNTSKHRVVIVEDEPKIRRNIAQKIEGSDSYEIVGMASDGVEAMNVIMELMPAVVFTDIKMPKMDGLELIRRVKENSPEIHFVIISGYDEFEYAQSAMKLGVRDYLLKPVSLEALNECLKNISVSLQYRNYQMTREMLTLSINGAHEGLESFTLSNQSFATFLVCIGNLCASVIPPEQYELFRELWRDVSFESIKNLFPGQNDLWIVVDEKAPNQKFVLVSAEDKHPEEIPAMAAEIQACLSKYSRGLPVQVCHHEFYVNWTDIWKQAQTIRGLLDRELVPCKSSILLTSNKSETPFASYMADQVLKNKVNALIQSGQTDILKNELFQVFKQWENAEYPQRLLEKVTMHLIRSIHLQTGVLSEEKLFSLESELYSKLAICPELSVFFGHLWELIEKMILIGDEDYDTYQLVKHVANYLELNYTKDINLEELAIRFHFTSSYLSKIFKKHYRETPLKYIIKLRIEEAKRLIIENPEREVGKIAEIVGYADQHYFSRVFKNATGMSPSEFRYQNP
ncbi:response regulator [Paenibacillus sp. KQZ6P-2]|uniref:Response regulator n=1 Tax=Paenibacillus mangrovi TaxID=2931978 RepID=A0A9X1WSL0_9BACL|nr:response regulator [Paenibacillus mangrovi]MCJ8014243.1 response regulator [Paenibacillus mangrovi]